VASLLTAVSVNNKNIVFKELKLKDYKTILKCLISEPIDTDSLFLNLNNILVKITNLTLEDVLNLNLLEYLLLLTHIRITSVGSAIFGVYKNNEESINVEINLYKTIQTLETFLQEFKENNYKDNTLTLTTIIPSINDLINNKDPIYIKENVNKLSIKYLKVVKSLTEKYNQFIQNFYFYKSPIEKYSIKLSFIKKEYCQLIKILFNENLLNVYDSIYYLCKLSHLTPKYLENCTYGEFKIYVKKTEEILYKNNKPPVENNHEPLYDPVDISSLYGNEDDPPITRSEFTP
jgi:hypothetical protein